MPELQVPSVTAVLDALKRLLARLLGVWRRVRASVVGVAATGTQRARSAVRTVRSRLRGRWHTDSAYRRTLTAALVAVIGTVLPHRAVAAALAAVVAETGTGYRPSRPAWYDADEFEDDESDEDPYAPRWVAPGTRTPDRPSRDGRGRLWDVLE